MRSKSILISAVLLLCTCTVNADLVTIEADNFAAGTNLSHAFDYITLSVSNGDDIYSVESTAVGGKLGMHVLGCGLDEAWRYGPLGDYDYMGNYLIIEIDGFVETVSAMVAATTDRGINNHVIMYGFDSDWVRAGIGGQTVHLFEEAKSLGMTGSVRPISFVTIGLDWNSWAISIDRIRIDFTPIPEPSTLLLLGLGAVMLRKRR